MVTSVKDGDTADNMEQVTSGAIFVCLYLYTAAEDKRNRHACLMLTALAWAMPSTISHKSIAQTASTHVLSCLMFIVVFCFLLLAMFSSTGVFQAARTVCYNGDKATVPKGQSVPQLPLELSYNTVVVVLAFDVLSLLYYFVLVVGLTCACCRTTLRRGSLHPLIPHNTTL